MANNCKTFRLLILIIKASKNLILTKLVVIYHQLCLNLIFKRTKLLMKLLLVFWRDRINSYKIKKRILRNSEMSYPIHINLRLMMYQRQYIRSMWLELHLMKETSNYRKSEEIFKWCKSSKNFKAALSNPKSLRKVTNNHLKILKRFLMEICLRNKWFKIKFRKSLTETWNKS